MLNFVPLRVRSVGTLWLDTLFEEEKVASFLYAIDNSTET